MSTKVLLLRRHNIELELISSSPRCDDSSVPTTCSSTTVKTSNLAAKTDKRECLDTTDLIHIYLESPHVLLKVVRLSAENGTAWTETDTDTLVAATESFVQRRELRAGPPTVAQEEHGADLSQEIHDTFQHIADADASHEELLSAAANSEDGLSVTRSTSFLQANANEVPTGTTSGEEAQQISGPSDIATANATFDTLQKETLDGQRAASSQRQNRSVAQEENESSRVLSANHQSPTPQTTAE
jgi:hypothetical protein